MQHVIDILSRAIVDTGWVLQRTSIPRRGIRDYKRVMVIPSDQVVDEHYVNVLKHHAEGQASFSCIKEYLPTGETKLTLHCCADSSD